MKAPIADLSQEDKEQLSADIYYLNMQELRDFCDAREIPYIIQMETADGRVVQTRDADRKGIVIDRILHFLNTGAITPDTIFRKAVVSTAKLGRAPKESDRVLYRQYKNHDPDTSTLMKLLTDGKFEFGAIAQEVLRACWSRGEAPTYREFAALWQKAGADHTRPNPEWAFLTDLAKGTAGSDWKKVRNQKAAAVISILKKLG
ncbi:MAG: hypothetical protein ACLQDV_13660 [Candidatus Binataceae bacterium]